MDQPGGWWSCGGVTDDGGRGRRRGVIGRDFMVVQLKPDH